jgi:hypothetical protein
MDAFLVGSFPVESDADFADELFFAEERTVVTI